MIFQHTLDLVLSGRKTQTRRVVRPSDSAVTGPDGAVVAVLSGGREKWRVGGTYAVQPGRTQPAVARIRVTALRREPARQISEADALAEGATSRDDYLQTFARINGQRALDGDCWVVTFELVE